MNSNPNYKVEAKLSENSFNKILAKWFSGASAEIIRELLPKDTTRYSRIATYNIILSILCGWACYFIASVFFGSGILASVLCACGAFLFALLLLIYNNGRLINRETRQFQQMLAFIPGVVISMLIAIGSVLYRVDYNQLHTPLPGSIKNISSFSERLNAVIKLADLLTMISFFLIFLSSLSIFYLIVITIRSGKTDFYHQLLDEKRSVESEYLNQRRKEITENYRLNTELKSISTGLDDLQGMVDEAGKLDIRNDKEELGGTLTPSGLLTAAKLIIRTMDFNKGLEYLNKAIELESTLVSENKQYRFIPEIYELKATTLRALRLPIDAGIAERQAIRIREENSFLENLSKCIKLEKLAINDISIFDNFTWYFKPGINILLGKNGYGKSHLLALIIALMYDDKEKRKDWISGSKAGATAALYLTGDVPEKGLEAQLSVATKELREKQNSMDNEVNTFIASSTKQLSDEELEKMYDSQIQEIKEINAKIIRQQTELSRYKPTISADVNTIKSLMGRLPLLAIPDSRFINKSVDSVAASDSEFSDIAKYGAYEFLYSKPYAQVIENVLFKTCINYFKGGANFQQEPFGLIQRVIKDLSSDKLITKDGKLVYQDDSKFAFVSIVDNDKQASFTIKVRPEDADIELPLQKISQGTFSMVSICCLIYNYLISIPQKEPDVLKRVGVVIIDELDAHIHPTWQRKLIQIFRKNFPNVQFIISGHSPLLVEGCKANEVSVLRRTSAGKFKIDTIERSMIGLSIVDIYSFIFELENKDFAMLRYKELAPYLESFKKELEELRSKGDNLSNEDTDRILQLQDMINHIDISAKTFEKLDNDIRNESRAISDFLTSAVKAVINTNNKT